MDLFSRSGRTGRRAVAALALALGGAGLGGAAFFQGSAPAVAAARAPTAAPLAAGAMLAMARTCLSPYSQTGHNKLQGPAAALAKTRWNQVRPDGYSKFNDSDGQDVTCRHDGRKPLFRTWTCVATATPCKEEEPGTVTVTVNTGTGTGTPICYGSFSAEGEKAMIQTHAENRAVDAWQVAAGGAYGANYQAWGNAQGAGLSCSHNGLGPMQRRWRCTATAAPCRKP